MTKKFIDLLLYSLIAVFLSSCSPYHLYYPYTIKSDLVTSKSSKIIVAPINLFTGSPSFFNQQELAVSDSLNNYISSKLEYLGKQELVKKKWDQQINSSNGLFDPLTGQLDHQKFESAIQKTVLMSLAISGADYIVFPHIIDREIKLAGANGYWDGVVREVEMKTNLRHSSDYNWKGNSSGYSLQIQVFDKNGVLVFENIGGIESRYALDFKNGVEVMVPKTVIFQNGKFITEAISIAMHPFIKSDIFPDNAKFKE